MRNIAKYTTLALAMGIVGAASASAQGGTGPRWQAWVGCWTSAGAGEAYGSSQFAAPIVCVIPTSNSDVVEVATIADGKVGKRDTIDASGIANAINNKDCLGSQVARWSADERRVYLSSSTTCFGMKSSVSSILAMSDKGEWLDIRGVNAGDGESVRVARYRDIGLPSSVPAEVADVLRGRGGSMSGARVAAGANIGTTAVAEASKAADEAVVEAWLLERGQRFALNANSLVALSDAGIPSRITDAMVAVSNPRAFNLARAEPSNRSDLAEEDARYGRRIPVYLDPYDPWGYGYSRYGYSRYGQYGYGYGSPYGYGGYGYYGGYSGPIIIVTGSQSGGTATITNPQVVKGRGYTQNSGTASSGRAASPSTESSSGSTSSTSTSTSQPQSQPQPQPSTQRTAKPRP
jgi:hypothetical protein